MLRNDALKEIDKLLLEELNWLRPSSLATKDRGQSLNEPLIIHVLCRCLTADVWGCLTSKSAFVQCGDFQAVLRFLIHGSLVIPLSGKTLEHYSFHFWQFLAFLIVPGSSLLGFWTLNLSLFNVWTTAGIVRESPWGSIIQYRKIAETPKRDLPYRHREWHLHGPFHHWTEVTEVLSTNA